MTDSRKRALKPEEAAEVLGKPVGTLNNWRTRGIGPVFYRVGPRSVRYFEDDLLRFLNSGRVEPCEGEAR